MTDLRTKYLEAYESAIAADAVFQSHLVRQFGKDACNRRYDARMIGWDCETISAGLLKVAADNERNAAIIALRAETNV